MIYTNRVSGTRLFLREKKGTEPGGGNKGKHAQDQ